MGEQLTIEIEKSLKKALLRYCEIASESPSSVVSRALNEFIAKAQSKEEEEWFGLPVEDYLVLPEEERETLWSQAYQAELDKPQLPEREARPDALTPRQRGSEALRGRVRESRKKSATRS